MALQSHSISFFYRTGELGNLVAPCNSHCRCSSSFYLAICGRDDIAYFSPCFAGCNQSKTFQNEKVIIWVMLFPLQQGVELVDDVYIMAAMHII